MNKNQLAARMVNDSDTTRTDALKVIDCFVDVTGHELTKKDGKLILVGFGTFKTIIKKKKKGRNPKTGAEIIIPKKRVVKFIPGKKLKEFIK